MTQLARARGMDPWRVTTAPHNSQGWQPELARARGARGVVAILIIVTVTHSNSQLLRDPRLVMPVPVGRWIRYAGLAPQLKYLGVVFC